MRIYTRKGDAGETMLPGGQRVPKHDIRIAACGDLDELNAAIGLCAALSDSESTRDRLATVQGHLLGLGADVAAVASGRQARPHITLDHVHQMEIDVDTLEATLTPLQNFILPGGAPDAATIHLARAICRRAERTLALLASQCDIPPQHLAFLNRLSDFLFVLARAVNAQHGVHEVIWRPESRVDQDA